jgi:hypothetical protein
VTNEREEIDPLEAELMALRPAEPSAELYAAVGQRLSERSISRRVVSWIAPAAAAAACAAVVAVALRNRPPDLLPPPTVRVTVAPAAVPAPGADRDRPALANYRGAADLSAAELDELLGRHAARSLAGGNAGQFTASSGFGLSH